MLGVARRRRALIAVVLFIIRIIRRDWIRLVRIRLVIIIVRFMWTSRRLVISYSLKIRISLGFLIWGFILVMVSRSEEHTSELQSRGHLVCRLLLEKKKANNRRLMFIHNNIIT